MTLPHNGAGVFAAPGSTFNPAVSGTVIDEVDWAALLADFTTALTLQICKDGQSTTTALIHFAQGISTTNTGLKVYDTNASHFLSIVPGSDLTAARALTFTTGDADRTVTLTGNYSMSGAFNLIHTITGNTNVTYPTTGTLATLAGVEAFTNKTITTPTLNGTPTLGDAAAWRTALALVAGTNVQAYDATLLSLATLGTAADKISYTTGVDTWAESAITSSARTLLASATAAIFTIPFIIDGGGATITTGVKGFIQIDCACTINAVTMMADQSGSIVVDIWKDVYSAYPPTVADTITASAKPTITTATKSQDTTLTGWTVSVAAGSILGFNVDSVTTLTRVTLSLKATRA